LRGTYQTWLKAFCVAPVMPRPGEQRAGEADRQVPGRCPSGSGRCSAGWSPMIGNWLSVEWQHAVSARWGLPCSTKAEHGHEHEQQGERARKKP